MKDMQMDYKDEFVAEVMPKLIEKLEQLKYIWSSPKHEEILDYLKSWDYVMHKNSIQATFYQVWEYLFQHSLFKLVDLNE
jgi:acyl-homoserine lactone acylase PvdQ